MNKTKILDKEFDLEDVRYLEALLLPKFEKSLERLMNRKEYETLLVCHHTDSEGLIPLVDKATTEGNAVIIQREYCGYRVIVWRN